MLAVMQSGGDVAAKVRKRKALVQLADVLNLGTISDGECGVMSVTVRCSPPLFDALVVASGDSTFVRITKSAPRTLPGSPFDVDE